MTNTSNPPLEIKHDQIEPTIREALRKIDEIARQHETSYFLAGATAREIILRHIFGQPPGLWMSTSVLQCATGIISRG
jgi:hypothetical protein